jgi:hypothetical protein
LRKTFKIAPSFPPTAPETEAETVEVVEIITTSKETTTTEKETENLYEDTEKETQVN